MTRIKICGVTRPEDAAAAVSGGADFIGINFWPRSKRYVPAERAPLLAAAARVAGAVQIAGVFVDTTVAAVVAVLHAVDLDIVQLHGDESAELARAIARTTGRQVWKALPATAAGRIAEYADAGAILLDTPTPERGGSGRTFDWAIAQAACRDHPARRFVLAGGLSPDNVAAAITAVAPWAVDVASGVESAPGIKDPAKITDLVAAVRSTTS
jgi:phosphoribosylanthranilate isomerase